MIRGGLEPCKSFWCPECYSVPEDENWFPIKKGLSNDSESIVKEDARDRGKYLSARAGDHLMTNFQCDLCHFRNIQKRDPIRDEVAKDNVLLTCIRRANLDALWSKESGTVEANQREIVRMIGKCRELGIPPSVMLPPKRPFPLRDVQFMGLAAVMVFRSLDAGKNDKFVQFNTVRHMRSSAHNYWKSSVNDEQTAVALKGSPKMVTSNSPTNSEWFEKFIIGYHRRVGDVVKPDLAISNELMGALMKDFERDWVSASGSREDEGAVLFPALFAILSYTASLRGEETTLLDLKATRENTVSGLSHPSKPHVVITLTGRFKNEVGVLSHDIPLVEKTSSGLTIRVWLERMLDWYGPNRSGYVFRDDQGNRVRTNHYAPDIFERIKNIQNSGLPEHKGLVDASVDVAEDFGMARSFRRGSDSRAIDMDLDVTTIELINRWRTTEGAKGKAPKLKMMAKYADIRLVVNRFLKYSENM